LLLLPPSFLHRHQPQTSHQIVYPT